MQYERNIGKVTIIASIYLIHVSTGDKKQTPNDKAIGKPTIMLLFFGSVTTNG